MELTLRKPQLEALRLVLATALYDHKERRRLDPGLVWDRGDPQRKAIERWLRLIQKQISKEGNDGLSAQEPGLPEH